MVPNEILIRAALEQGADNAAIIEVSEIAFRPEFREACIQNTCGKYGKCWMCPPDVGDIYTLIEEAKTYRYALVYQSIGQLEDSFDIEGMQEAAKVHKDLTLRLAAQFESILDSPLKMGAGGCHICERCARIDNMPCLHPSKAIISMEAYGIAVSELAPLCGMKYINGPNTVTYFGAFLFNS
ncbi:MAG: DUF2284 domain-containing protein [Saccharofermentanales bacterium]|jgi:predicted metal-binding protein